MVEKTSKRLRKGETLTACKKPDFGDLSLMVDSLYHPFEPFSRWAGDKRLLAFTELREGR